MGSSKALSLCLDEDPKYDYQQLCNPANSEKDDLSSAPLFGFDANSRTLYLKQIPVRTSRWDLLNLVR